MNSVRKFSTLYLSYAIFFCSPAHLFCFQIHLTIFYDDAATVFVMRLSSMSVSLRKIFLLHVNWMVAHECFSV